MSIDLETIAAARAAQAKWKVPASVTLAQYGLESGWGVHMPANSFNPFGIKALAGQPSVTALTAEYYHGQRVMVQAAFRKFASLAEAFDAHAELLATKPVYEMAMSCLPDVRKFIHWMAARYATDPKYEDLIWSIISEDKLLQYDT